MAGLSEHEANPRGEENLGNQGDVKRTPRISRSLQPACVGQRDRNEETRDAEESQQLPPEPYDNRIVEAEDAKQLVGNQQEERADRGGDSKAHTSGDVNGVRAAIGAYRAKVLAGDTRRRSHQPDRGAGDQRKELGVPDSVR